MDDLVHSVIEPSRSSGVAGDDEASVFVYSGYDLDPGRNQLTCHYRTGSWRFTEVFTFTSGGDWDAPAVPHLARLVYLLAGVSYFKATAPPLIDLGEIPLTATERRLLRDFYVEGLGEFAYRAGMDLTGLRFTGGRTVADVAPEPRQAGTSLRPLIPFGGGLDSIVSVEMLREVAPDAALFVVNYEGTLFEAIEGPAEVTGLPVVRVERRLDPQILVPAAHGFHTGHVPITGIISALALVAAALRGHDTVVMSNEWSASSATLIIDGREINHQYSKSEGFETALQGVLARVVGAPDYFSLLRRVSELWIARYFADHCQRYLFSFRSCNRAFRSDPTERPDTWCGECDKCAFIDLILSPFLSAETLDRVFAGGEPLTTIATQVMTNLEGLLDETAKPWECVGDVRESQIAVRMATQRPDRAGSMLPVLAARLPKDPQWPTDAERLLRPLASNTVVPARYAAVLV